MNAFQSLYENLLREDFLLKQNTKTLEGLLRKNQPGLKKLSLSHSSASFRIYEKTFLPLCTSFKLIAGQYPQKTRGKKPNANFKLLARDLLGCELTIKKGLLYSFLLKFSLLVLPSMRNFEGFHKAQLNTRGFSLGLTDLLTFLELEETSSFFDKIRGADISFACRASTSTEEVSCILTGFFLPMKIDEKKES